MIKVQNEVRYMNLFLEFFFSNHKINPLIHINQLKKYQY